MEHTRGTSHTQNPYFTPLLTNIRKSYLSVAFDVSAGAERAKTALSSGSPLPPSVEVYFVWECEDEGGGGEDLEKLVSLAVASLLVRRRVSD